MKKIFTALAIFLLSSPAFAATSIPFTITMSEAVNVTGNPRIAVDVGGVTRYATYASGTGTNALTFTYQMVSGDVDLDGVTLSSPIDLNGGTITDLNGNPETDLTFTVPDTSGIKINYPSLSMDFIADADGRYTLNGTAYNDLPSFLTATSGTFSRNSVGTYYDASGVLQTASANQPRFDHDPVTHAPKGILIEESRTNLLHYSDFQSNWNISRVNRIFNATIAPDGTMSAIELIEDNTGGGQHGINPSTGYVPFVAGQSYTFSMYVKRGAGARNIVVGSGNASIINLSASFNLGTGTVISAGTGVTALITEIGSGWFRLSVSNVALTTTSNYVSFALMEGDTTYSYYIGNGTDSLYCWGPQVEQGSFPTSYIPTTTAAVTRVADALSIPTGVWTNTSTASLFVTADTIPFNSGLSGAIPVSYISDGTPNNEWGIRFETGGTVTGYTFIVGGINQTTIYAHPVLSGVNKLAYAMSLNTRSSYSNGGSLSTGSYSSSPPSTVMGVGKNISSQYLNGWIEKLKYYPARVSDIQLKIMTQ